MMNTKQFSLVVTVISAALLLSACSSSDNDNTANQQADTNAGSGGAPVTPVNQPSTGTDGTTTPANGGAQTPSGNGTVTSPNNDVPLTTTTGGITPVSNDPTPSGSGSSTTLVDLRLIKDDILRSLAGYELEMLGEEIALLAEGVVSSATTSIKLPDGSAQLVIQSNTQTIPVTRVRYECPQGGTLTTETVSDGEFSSRSFFEINNVNYLFDQCVLAGNNSHNLNGGMALNSYTESANRASIDNNTLNYSNFIWIQPGGETLNIDANIAVNISNSPENDDETRLASIMQFTRSVGGMETSGIREAGFSLNEKSDSTISEFSLETAGKIADASGAAIDVLADPALGRKFFKAAAASAGNQPFNGQITFSSSDGSSLQLVANGTDASGNRLANITYTDANGESTTLANQRVIDLDIATN